MLHASCSTFLSPQEWSVYHGISAVPRDKLLNEDCSKLYVVYILVIRYKLEHTVINIAEEKITAAGGLYNAHTDLLYIFDDPLSRIKNIFSHLECSSP